MPEPFDYKAQPLGSLPGEAHLRIAYNQVPVNCVVRVRNLSGEHKRKIIIEAVSLRRGGERLRPDARGPRRTLKNLLQEHGVPQWARKSLPLIYVDGVLACVPGVAIDAAFRAATGEPAIRPEWRPIRP